MNSKEALLWLQRLAEDKGDTLTDNYSEEIEVIRKDLDLLKKYKKTVKVLENRLIDFSNKIIQLEIANKNNENLVKENVRLVNENLLLKDKYKNAIENLKKELCFEFHEPSKSFDFYAINLKLYKDDDDYTTIILDSDEKDKFFALKEVFENE